MGIEKGLARKEVHDVAGKVNLAGKNRGAAIHSRCHHAQKNGQGNTPKSSEFTGCCQVHEGGVLTLPEANGGWNLSLNMTSSTSTSLVLVAACSIFRKGTDPGRMISHTAPNATVSESPHV